MRRLCRLRDGVSSFSLVIRKENPLPTRIRTVKKRAKERERKRESHNHNAGEQIFENISERNSTPRGYLSHSWKKGVDERVAIRNFSLLRRCNKNF